MDILLGALAGVAVTVAVVVGAVVIGDIITKGNIADKIKEVIRKILHRGTPESDPDLDPDQTEIPEDIEDIFEGEVTKKADKSIGVNVFFGNEENPQIMTVTLKADGIADDIHVGDRISFDEVDFSTVDDEEAEIIGIDLDDIEEPEVIDLSADLDIEEPEVIDLFADLDIEESKIIDYFSLI